MTFGLAAVCGAGETRYVAAPARTVPVAGRVDVVVVGGSEGGLAAAWQAAKNGAKVMLLAEHTFLANETVAKDRFDAFKEGPKPGTAFSATLFKELTAARVPVEATDILTRNGVKFLYNTRPGGVLVDGQGRLCGVVTANKAGLQAVVAKVVVDATQAGAVADAAGARRVLPDAWRIAASRPCYSGDKKKREVKTAEVTLADGLTWAALNRVEQGLREEWHVSASPPFAHEMDFIMPSRIVGEAEIGDELPPVGAPSFSSSTYTSWTSLPITT
jgi:hypothetical protein